MAPMTSKMNTRRTLMMVMMGITMMMMLSIQGTRATDLDLFKTMYDRVLETVVPGYNPLSNAPPSQVILFEMPGIAINRQDYDESAWTANGFVASQPDAMVARLVNRATYYTGPTFVDSGATVSGLWKSLLYQYIVPVIDNPLEEAKADKARAALANDTLSNAYNSKLDVYAATLAKFGSSRDDCLLKQAASICARNLVVWNERLRRAWFSLEVARRELEGAEARLLALQVQDLTSTFADALETFASAERVDVGAAGAGLTYYYTSLTPSTWWQWWPQNVGSWDFTATYPTPLAFNFTKPNAAIALQPSRGSAVLTGSLVVYTPYQGSGIDRIGFSYTDALSNSTLVSIITINVIGNDVSAADSAFIKLVISSSQAQSSSSSSSAFGQSFQSSSDTSIARTSSFNWWSYSGSSSTATSSSSSAVSSYSTSASFSSSSSDVAISFSLARVNIQRPWLDISLLSYYPVAIRGVGKNAWSDGSVQPSPRVLQSFKLLPVAFIVARNIVISSSSWGSTFSITQSAGSRSSATSSSSSSERISIGPFFAGSSSSGAGAAASAGRSYQERSSFKVDSSVSSTGGALSIQGPQIIAWACAPVPAFPNASEDDVIAFEQTQLNKARAILALNAGNLTAAVLNTTK